MIILHNDLSACCAHTNVREAQICLHGKSINKPTVKIFVQDTDSQSVHFSVPVKLKLVKGGLAHG